MGNLNRAFTRVKQIFKPKPAKHEAPMGKAYGRTESVSLAHRSSFKTSPKRKGKTRGSISKRKMNYV